jgi:putative oxidoreductase
MTRGRREKLLYKIDDASYHLPYLIHHFVGDSSVKLFSAPEFSSLGIPRPLAWAAFVVRFLFGGLFLLAGILKASDPGEFLLNIRSFQMIGDPWAAILAVGLPWLEIFGGAALMLGSLVRGALLVFLTSITVFLIALTQAWARGLDVTCGCFGSSENRTNYPSQIIFDLVLLAIAGSLWWVGLKLTPFEKARGSSDFRP